MTTYESGLALSNKVEKVLNNIASYYIDLGGLFQSKNVDGKYISKLLFKCAELNDGTQIEYTNSNLYNIVPYRTLYDYLETITLNSSDGIPKLFMITDYGDNTYMVYVNGYKVKVSISKETGLSFEMQDSDFTPTESLKNTIEQTLLTYFSFENPTE